MTESFADVTAVEKDAQGRYQARIPEGWDIGGVPNGGFVLAIAGRAMSDSVGRPPLSVTAHYLSPTRPGPVSIRVERVRAGKRLAVLAGTLLQDDREAIRVLGTFGESSGADPLLVDGEPPKLPPFEDCVVVDSSTPRRSDQAEPGTHLGGGWAWPQVYDRLAVRWRPGDEGFGRGEPTGRAEIAGWFAFAAGCGPDGTGGSDKSPSAARIDAIGLLLVADAFAPPVFNIGLGPGWVPTLELTVHIRAVPVPGPLRCVFRTHYVQGGLLSEDGEIWDEADVLVAQSRQLALVPRA